MALSSLAGGPYRSPIFRIFLLSILLVASANANHISNWNHNEVCVIHATNNGSDDTPAILSAFQRCGQGGNIIFQNTTYTIHQVMNTTGLSDCQIDIHGTLLWSTDTTYWLNHSMDVGYQNQSSAWFLGGNRITVNGFGYGTLDGNGQVWYDLVKGQSNYPHRPMGLTIWNAKDSTFQGLRFVQSQMWTMAILKSQNVLLEDIYVNSTTHNGNPARNTDGADTIFSDRITFRKWVVDNGDDCISLKANSTNIIVEDSIFHRGLGLALGSIGQYLNQFETIENVYAQNITCFSTRYAAYIKTWTGQQVGYPPNGGGGGLGYIKNITWKDFGVVEINSYPFYITQCTTFSGVAGDCNSSLFEILDVSLENFHGTGASSYAAYMGCSAASGGCKRISIKDMNVTGSATNVTAVGYRCDHVYNTTGFQCN
ncbi:glycoside hydrolase family 28 protein [Glonium stellatum]|uniref:Glycoside hydrolase family 28 protein n=1 Tax=Glonium stellatum TaxID=574774 RepID=A0A8E2EMQ0_9PEZI|nr:glycoside hydrolase family 28 protein [Glonium stellatum]